MSLYLNNNQNMKTGNNWLTYTSTDCLNSETFASAKITINGQDRIPLMHASYYRDVVPYEIQTYFPRKYIYTYIESHISIYQYVVIQSRYKPFIQEYTYYIYETIDNTA